MNLTEAIDMLEGMLAPLPAAGGFLREPLPCSDESVPYEGPCSVCGKQFRMELERRVVDKQGTEELRWPKMNSIWVYRSKIKLPDDDGHYFYDFPVCSEECQLMGKRILECVIEKRREQWENIRKARNLLKEARAWLKRNPAA